MCEGEAEGVGVEEDVGVGEEEIVGVVKGDGVLGGEAMAWVLPSQPPGSSVM